MIRQHPQVNPAIGAEYPQDIGPVDVTHPARGLVEQNCRDKSAVDPSRSIDGSNFDQAENEHAKTHNRKERPPTEP